MTNSDPKIPPVIFEQNDYLKGVFLTHVARSVQNGFYQSKNYFVVPYSFPSSNAVFFPDLPYGKKFWRSLKDPDLKIGPFTENVPINIASSLTPKIKNSPNREAEWRQFEAGFWETFLSIGLLTQGLTGVSDIKVVPVAFGTGGSMIISYHPDGRKRLTLSLRNDHPINCIADMIIKELLVLRDIPYYINRYEDRQAVGRFIMNEPKLIELFAPDRRKHPLKKTVPIELQLESKKYLEKLGLAEKPIIKTVNGTLLINNKRLDRQVSPEELRLFSILWQKRGHPVSIDVISDSVWPGSEENFSPWAITKIVERTRKKIRNITGNPDLIMTIRGQGYMMIP